MAKHMKRREFICGGIAAFGIGALGTDAWAEMARHPLAGKVLPKWEPKGQSLLIQVRQAKLGRTNSGRSYIVKKSTYD
jgi:hypothetical protein